jgi:hypothetical protein
MVQEERDGLINRKLELHQEPVQQAFHVLLAVVELVSSHLLSHVPSVGIKVNLYPINHLRNEMRIPCQSVLFP